MQIVRCGALPDQGCSCVACERRSRSAGSDTGWPAGSERPSGRRSSSADADPSPRQRREEDAHSIKVNVAIVNSDEFLQDQVCIHLHLVHDGIGTQDVVLLLRVALCILHGPGGLSARRKANHHQNLTQVERKAQVNIAVFSDFNHLKCFMQI